MLFAGTPPLMRFQAACPWDFAYLDRAACKNAAMALGAGIPVVGINAMLNA